MSKKDDHPKEEEQEYEGDGPNLRYDDFVGRIVGDPNEPPCVTLLSGYLGSSSEEGHVRLYLDEELCRYVEIPEKAIRHTQELSPEQSPLGGSLVWIDRDAEVLHGPAGSERRKATFLEGQIAQDYMGGGGGFDYGGGVTTQTRECGPGFEGGEGILPTDMGPGCGTSRVAVCYQQPTQQVYCRTLTGILCTRFGPLCGRSVYYPCFTKSQPYCYESGPEDFTIYEQPGAQQQFGQQAIFAAGGGGGAGAAGFAGPTIFCPPTRNLSCQSRYVVACYTRYPRECSYETALRCVSRVYRCPTVAEPRCYISAAGPFCPDTVAVCQADSAFCGVDPGEVAMPRGGVAARARMDETVIMTQCDMVCFQHTQTPDCAPSAAPACNAITRTPRCHFGAVGGGGGGAGAGPAVAAPQSAFCPTRFNCPSRFAPCQSQFVRCPSALDACPTRYNCPSLPNGCPGHTRFGACETYGPCPSAVDACPTRFGCYETAMCGESIACYPGGGGGGFDPGRFGGGGGGF